MFVHLLAKKRFINYSFENGLNGLNRPNMPRGEVMMTREKQRMERVSRLQCAMEGVCIRE
jgi:hypothetical protein